MSSTPTVYFIDDSATMREVIKIAFRRENINVIACHDAATAFAEIEQTRPDVVITDVIMPDKDGYEVCQYIKQNPKFCSSIATFFSPSALATHLSRKASRLSTARKRRMR